MSRSFLVEIGTEELPPKSLKTLMNAFAQGLSNQLNNAGLDYSEVRAYATPRRLAVLVKDLAEQQPDVSTQRLGPALKAAYDADGAPTAAALGFARSCGIDTAQLHTADTDKGPRLAYSLKQAGAKTTTLLPACVEQALTELPIDKRMRWGASRVEFVRPAHWVVMLYGQDIVAGEVLGIQTGNQTRGHRFHHPAWLVINSSDDYVSQLREVKVMVDFAERRQQISTSAKQEAERLGGFAVIDANLLDEVTALNEWPVALAGNFDERFLQVPVAALVSSMKEHQKYFHVTNSDGELLPVFITVANLESRDPAQVIAGNEKVVRPRLADAAFFYETDLKTPLRIQRQKLHHIVFQDQLGSLFDKTERIARLSTELCPQTGADASVVKQAAELSKADLVTEMVQEFADLQGVMGKHYAAAEGLDEALATALAEQYLPRFSGDALPTTSAGVTLAIADRLDTLVGIFAIGQAPSGSSDPFALRRASLAVLRILLAFEIDLDLRDSLTVAVKLHTGLTVAPEAIEQALTYILERLKSIYDDQNIASPVVQAVFAKQLSNPLDITRRVTAVAQFAELEEAAALAAANKRVANILAKQGNGEAVGVLQEHLLTAPEEVQLTKALRRISGPFHSLLSRGKYGEALASLAALKEPVDMFFDKVMVMADDAAVRENRLALLNELRALFLEIADISPLVPGKSS